jgi:hypothetical protein
MIMGNPLLATEKVGLQLKMPMSRRGYLCLFRTFNGCGAYKMCAVLRKISSWPWWPRAARAADGDVIFPSSMLAGSQLDIMTEFVLEQKTLNGPQIGRSVAEDVFLCLLGC